MEAFRLAAGFEAVHVPFQGAPEALTEVLSERADFYFSPLTARAPFLKDGKLQALAVSGSQRAWPCPDVPTINEAGYPEATYNFWVGLFAAVEDPAGRSSTGFIRRPPGAADAGVEGKLAPRRRRSLPLDRAGFAKLIQDEFVLNSKVAKAAGIKVN